MNRKEFEDNAKKILGNQPYIMTFMNHEDEYRIMLEVRFGKGFAIDANASDAKIDQHLHDIIKYLEDDFCDCLARYLEDRGYSVEDISLRPS